jgi:hypothetical protein
VADTNRKPPDAERPARPALTLHTEKGRPMTAPTTAVILIADDDDLTRRFLAVIWRC